MPRPFGEWPAPRHVWKRAISIASGPSLCIEDTLLAQSTGWPLITVNSGTIVALSCDIDINDKDKTVELGSWPTRQLQKAGVRSSPVMFAINLTGCPVGKISAVFNGKGDSSDNSLLALSEDSTAKNVAIEIQDKNHKRVPLGQSAPYIQVNANGDARLQFYANYFIPANSPTAGSANSGATFTINYE